MKRGSTPTHTFTLPVGKDMIKNIEITYAQMGQIILQKYTQNCTISGNTAFVTLSQLDTLEFADGVNVEIQIRVLDKSGTVHSSDIMCISCDKCLSAGVLV